MVITVIVQTRCANSGPGNKLMEQTGEAKIMKARPTTASATGGTPSTVVSGETTRHPTQYLTARTQLQHTTIGGGGGGGGRSPMPARRCGGRACWCRPSNPRSCAKPHSLANAGPTRTPTVPDLLATEHTASIAQHTTAMPMPARPCIDHRRAGARHGVALPRGHRRPNSCGEPLAIFFR